MAQSLKKNVKKNLHPSIGNRRIQFVSLTTNVTVERKTLSLALSEMTRTGNKGEILYNSCGVKLLELWL